MSLNLFKTLPGNKAARLAPEPDQVGRITRYVVTQYDVTPRGLRVRSYELIHGLPKARAAYDALGAPGMVEFEFTGEL